MVHLTDDYEPQRRGGDRSGVMLAFLAGVCFFQSADVVIFSMTSEPVRLEFGFSDLQMGLLNGSAFALLYAFAGIPLARIADRGYRRNVIAISLAFWSLCTALTAIATGFASLFAIRLLVGIGEAGVMPAAFSLIAARFAPSRRAGAMSWMQSGRYLGTIAGLSGAGLAVAWIGWRHTFLLFGVPGILLAIAILIHVREPRDLTAGRAPPIRDVFASLRRRTILHLFALLASSTMITFGIMVWAPAFYIRSYGMNTVDVGFWMGVALGGGLMIGTLAGGLLSDRFASKYSNGGLIIAFWGIAANFPLGILTFLAPDQYWSLGLMLASNMIGAVCVAPTYAALQTLTEAKFRATAIALILSGVALAGQGIGPLLVGAISDAAKLAAGSESLRWSLVAVSVLRVWPLYHAWRMMKLYPTELELIATRDAAKG